MVTVITDNRVRNRVEYLPLAKAFAEETAASEKGCCSMEVLVDRDQEDRVVFLSTWEKREDFLASVGGEIFSKHIPGMGPYYVSGTDSFLDRV